MRARHRWGQQKGLIAHLAAEQGVALTPELEAPRNGIEHPGFVQGALVKGRLSEKAGAQLGIPANVVPWTELVLEKARQPHALCTPRFQHPAGLPQPSVRD